MLIIIINTYTFSIIWFFFIEKEKEREEEDTPARFSWSHFEFFGRWLSHHQEYERRDSEWDKVAMTPENYENTNSFDLPKA